MILISTDRLKEGMIVGQAIYTSSGVILLEEGIELKYRYIEKLNELGISNIYINESLTDNLELYQIVKEDTKIEALTMMKSIMNDVALFDDADASNVANTVSKIVDGLLDNDDILINLIDIRTVDDYTFGHSVNVCILSLVTAISLGYEREQLIDLGIGAILHDIGKTQISIDILNKPYELTLDEYKEIKKHTLLGYGILKKLKTISNEAINIALLHHERYDGNGYPNNLKATNIHEFARIVSVADVYDALTTNRVYRKQINSDIAINYLLSMAGSQFDEKMVEGFMKSVAKYPLGKGVVLNSGEKGYVIKNRKENINKPIVKVLYDKEGKILTSPFEVDLLHSTSYAICRSTDDIDLK